MPSKSRAAGKSPKRSPRPRGRSPRKTSSPKPKNVARDAAARKILGAAPGDSVFATIRTPDPSRASRGETRLCVPLSYRGGKIQCLAFEGQVEPRAVLKAQDANLAQAAAIRKKLEHRLGAISPMRTVAPWLRTDVLREISESRPPAALVRVLESSPIWSVWSFEWDSKRKRFAVVGFDDELSFLLDSSSS